jgi:hypothetical protein
MKRLLIILSLLLSMSAVACARNVILNWSQPDEQTGMSWNAYRKAGACTGPGSFAKINPADLTVKTHTDSDVPFGRLSYQVTAQVTVDGSPVESTPSNCAEVVVTPNSPQNLTLTLDPP